LNPLHIFAFHGGHGGHAGSIWPLIQDLHDHIPAFLPEWARWTMVVIFIASVFFLLTTAITWIKARTNPNP
jgi:hypothetical protein